MHSKVMLSLSCTHSAHFMAGAGPPSFLGTFVAQEAQRVNSAALEAPVHSFPFQGLCHLGKSGGRDRQPGAQQSPASCLQKTHYFFKTSELS